MLSQPPPPLTSPLLLLVTSLLLVMDTQGIGYVCPITQCRCTLSRDIICSNKRLKEVPTIKKSFETPVASFNIYDLTGNDIERIPAYCFRGLKLQGIHIENNPLIGISPNAFTSEYCTMLKSLSIIDTPIRVIHWSMFRRLVNLERLDLSSNLMRFIPNGVFANLVSLQILTLSSNSIQQWKSKVIRTLPKLKRLDLSNNKIFSIQKNSFIGPISLVWLNLANNRISVLNKTTFSGLHRLEVLLLANNQLKSLDRIVLDNLPVLRHLELSNNNISQLTKRIFMSINKVESISLRNNNIYMIANDAFLNLKYFTLLRLDDNYITQFGEQLDDNSIDTCPPNGLISLVQLSLSGNPLNCTCPMFWVKRMAQTRLNGNAATGISAHAPRTPTTVTGTCSTPFSLAGHDVAVAPFVGCFSTKCKAT